MLPWREEPAVLKELMSSLWASATSALFPKWLKRWGKSGLEFGCVSRQIISLHNCEAYATAWHAICQIVFIWEKAVLKLDLLHKVSLLSLLRFKKGFKTENYCHFHVTLHQPLAINHTCNHLRCIYDSQMIYILQFMASELLQLIWFEVGHKDVWQFQNYLVCTFFSIRKCCYC